MRRSLGAVVAGAVAVSLMAALPASPVSAGATLGRGDWDTICVNRNTATGRRFVANDLIHANCRETKVGDDPRTRRYLVSVPQSALDREGRIPVVFMFHGSTGTGEQYWQISRWRELAAQEGFIAVFPSGLPYQVLDGGRATKWNDAGLRCEVVHPELLADDVGFVDTILADLRAQLPVDNRRIFASGFSNGSAFTFTLAAARGDVFGAVGSWAGAVRAQTDECSYEPASGDATAPVWFGVGSHDDRFGYVEGVKEVPLSVAGMETWFDGMLDRATEALGLRRQRTGTTTVDALVTQPDFVPSVTPRWSRVMRFADPLPGNTSGNELLWMVLDDCIHSLPNSGPNVGMNIVRKSKDVSMAALQWQWFLDHPLPRGGR